MSAKPSRIGVRRTVHALLILFALAVTGACSNSTDRIDAPVGDPALANGPANRPPQANKDTVLASENAQLLLAVLGNDYDPDGDPLRIASVNPPQHGTAELDNRDTEDPLDDIIRYEAATAYTGLDSFTYTLSDGRGGLSQGLVVITVGNTVADNRRPAPKADAAATEAGVTTAIEVLGNDADPDNDTLLIVALSPAAHGRVRLDNGATPSDTSDDRLVYTPDPGFTGTDSFVYTVSDGRMSASAPVVVAVDGDPPDTSNLLSGHVIKGPVRGATVSLFDIDAAGALVDTLPVATAVTDDNGFWFTTLTQSRGDLLVVSAGGQFDDENDPSAGRTTVLASSEQFETVMPAAEQYVALTIYTNAMIVKARADVEGANFAAVFERSREQYTTALGFDPLATTPASPTAPDVATGADALAYAQAIGGAGNALNDIASRLGLAVPTHAMIAGLIQDLSDCRLDAEDRSGPIALTRDGVTQTLPVASDLGLSMVRFRNNRAAAYAGIAPAQIDLTSCEPVAQLPDRTAPVFAPLPAPLNITSADPVAASHPDIVAALAAVTAVDDRGGRVAVLNDAPAVFVPGLTQIRFTAQDAAGNATSATLAVTVTATNRAPQLLATIGVRSATEGVPLSLDLASFFRDPDGDPLGYSLTGLPADSALVFDTANGFLTGTPGNLDAANGRLTLTVSASDGALSVSEAFSLVITAVNEAPVITAQLAPLTTDEDTAIAITLANLEVSDRDNVFPTDFTLTVRPGANYSLAGNTLVPAPNFTGTLSVPVTVNDGALDSATFNLTVTVNAANDAPVITTQATSLVTAEDTALAITLADITVSDPDNAYPDDFTLTVQPGANYTLAGNTLTPTANFNGTLDVGITVNDGALESTVFHLVVNVSPVNDRPVITAQTAALVTAEDNALAVGLTDVTVIDPDNAYPGEFTLAVQPGLNYSLTGNAVTPASNFNGVLSVPVTVNDGALDSAMFQLVVSVFAVNDPPLAANDSFAAATDMVQTHVVLGNDTDVEEDILTLVAVTTTTTQGGDVSINDNGTPADPQDDYIDYLSPPGFVGTDSYEYTISDGTDTAVATVTVKVSLSGYVQAIVPLDETTDVAVTSDVTIEFNEAMDSATMTGAHLVLSPSVSGTPALATTVSYDPSNLVATLAPTSELAVGTTFHVIVESTVRNNSGTQQGFRVHSRFTTAGDGDGDGLSSATEIALAATLHPCLSVTSADSDGDGLGDGLEVDTGSDPCFDDPAQPIYRVDDDGPSQAWPDATTTVPVAPTPGTPTSPTMVLLASGVYPDRINLDGNCDNIVYAGSLDPAQPGGQAQTDADGRPSTRIDMGNLRNSELNGCSNATLHHLELSHGIGAPGKNGTRGGGLRVAGGSTVMLEGVWLQDNTVSDQGGGLCVADDATVATVRDSVFANNLVTAGLGGGGIWVGGGATLDIADSRILRNTADFIGGGGVYLDAGSIATISRIVVAGNRATVNDGGGIAVYGPGTVATISDSVISGNYAGDKAGGMDFERTNGDVHFKNSLVTGNYAGNDGGGMHSFVAAGTLVSHCTFVFNQALDGGGGAQSIFGAPFISNSIFFNNRASRRKLASPVMAGDSIGTFGGLDSDYNLLEVDADGFNDIDLTALGRSPDFVAGYYLDQSVSLAVDSGSGSALAAGLDTQTTASDGRADTGTVDRGFHQATGTPGPATGVALIQPTAALAPFSPMLQDIVVQPLNATSDPLGAAQEVVFKLVSAPAGFTWAPFADVEPLGAGSVFATDEGNGYYRVTVDTSTAAAGSLEFDVLVNGVTVGAVIVPIGP